MSIIEKYLKKAENIDLDLIKSSYLPKFKSYLKILDLSYILENTNLSITSEIVKEVIKKTYIFNDIILTFKPQINKISSKSDLVIVWVDILDL